MIVDNPYGNIVAGFYKDDLKPCPFCGSKDVYIEYYEHHPGAMRCRPVCTHCMAMIDAGWWQSKYPAVVAWNTRVKGE